MISCIHLSFLAFFSFKFPTFSINSTCSIQVCYLIEGRGLLPLSIFVGFFWGGGGGVLFIF
jgi:hypothetical protein